MVVFKGLNILRLMFSKDNLLKGVRRGASLLQYPVLSSWFVGVTICRGGEGG